MAVRKWHMSRALESYSALNEVIGELTEEEVLACLDLEAATRRRRTIVDRLISRAVRLHEIPYATHLKEKYCGTYPQDPEPRRTEGPQVGPEEGAR
jgi:hypothetical protein